jgi:hypothetical protein
MVSSIPHFTFDLSCCVCIFLLCVLVALSSVCLLACLPALPSQASPMTTRKLTACLCGVR